MDIKQIEYNRAMNHLPDLFYYQMNGKDAYANYNEQRKKMSDKYNQQEQLKKFKKDLQQQIFDAVIIAFDDQYSFISNAMIEDLSNKMSAAFNGKKIMPEKLTNRSFSFQLGNAIARALALAPFKLLDEFFDDINSH